MATDSPYPSIPTLRALHAHLDDLADGEPTGPSAPPSWEESMRRSLLSVPGRQYTLAHRAIMEALLSRVWNAEGPADFDDFEADQADDLPAWNELKIARHLIDSDTAPGGPPDRVLRITFGGLLLCTGPLASAILGGMRDLWGSTRDGKLRERRPALTGVELAATVHRLGRSKSRAQLRWRGELLASWLQEAGLLAGEVRPPGIDAVQDLRDQLDRHQAELERLREALRAAEEEAELEGAGHRFLINRETLGRHPALEDAIAAHPVVIGPQGAPPLEVALPRDEVRLTKRQVGELLRESACLRVAVRALAVHRDRCLGERGFVTAQQLANAVDLVWLELNEDPAPPYANRVLAKKVLAPLLGKKP
ncbi:MAG: hypothetical protein V2J02_18790 [Pseudomonadales bacterium]|jgi:hypothetical protein|nr:hypothetical protein [Pseudomonadales bacterium]